MTGKPFRPPSFIRRPIQPIETPPQEPPLKKRRVSQEDDSDTPIEILSRPKKIEKAFREPLLTVQNHTTPQPATTAGSSNAEGYYNVLWRKFTTKKHKTWDGDGILAIAGGTARLQDISGKELGKISWSKPLLPGSTLSVGGKDVEVDSIISKDDFLAGRRFLQSTKPLAAVSVIAQSNTVEKKPGKKVLLKQEKIEAKQVENVNVTATTSKATKSQFKNPLLNSTTMAKPFKTVEPVPRHDPKQPGSLVMRRPASVPKGKQVVDVVVDPILCRKLRDHQRQGVSFLYECVMGMRSHGGEGAILADEMGLGKTLQTIALLWTLLKQNPIYEEPPVVKKALIVCPATLINNWRKEFRKWLGSERVGVFVADGKFRITDFTKGRAYSVMVIGYEKLRNVIDDLKKCSIDIVIADEGHRLKTAKNKAAEAIRSLNTERRVLLTGTPVQNDLSEFFVMVDLVNPGLLGKPNTFKKEFETPIVKSRQPEATEKDVEKGEGRSKELTDLTAQFILRRTADLLSRYLPPKTEYVLFCRPTGAQATIYKNIISSPVFSAALGSTDMALQLITILKKVCNSPTLLRKKTDDETKPSEMLSSILATIPPQTLNSPGISTKLRVLDSFLQYLKSSTSEKVVIVSNYTATLDILGRLLTANSYPFTRLDGTISTSKRQDIVDRFNNTSQSNCFAFLLSAKSGGAGLNLIGASRLVLFDVDWNPATDLQAMARIHRDGQKFPCRIYRLLVKGALDEKIYQRQLSKMGLADAVVDNKASMASFSQQELRNLFSLDERVECQTHELLNCKCGGRGNVDAGTKLETPPELSEMGDDGQDDDDDSSLPDIPALLKASQVNMEEQERRIREQAVARQAQRGGSNMAALMQYLHIDVKQFVASLKKSDSPDAKRKSIFIEDSDDEDRDVDATEIPDVEVEVEKELINDEVLLEMLKDENSRVDFLFAKTTG